MSFKVKLTIFKPTGKYYTDGEYVSEKDHMHEIFDEVRTMAIQRRLPGLTPGSTTPWMVLIDVPDHQHDHPHIVVAPGNAARLI